MEMKLYYVVEMKKHWETQEETPVYIAGPFGAYTDAFEDSRLCEGFYWNYEVVETTVEVE